MDPRAPRTETLRALAAAVLFPFLLSRALLLAVAWFGRQFAPSWTYFDPAGATRGWSRVPALALDVWGRYDTVWYLDIAARGYLAPAVLLREQSTLAFFPLYPWLVRGLHTLLPAAWQGDAARYLAALALSNALALCALGAVYALVRAAYGDEARARRAVLYLVLFPGSFFLSCAYSESLFLFLAAAALLAGFRGRWGLAGACALLLGLTRPAGVLVAPALAVLYLEQRAFDLRRVRWDALALVAAPASLLAHAAHLALLTGDPWALLHAQAAWGRALSLPWATLLSPAHFHPVMGPLELAATLLFLALSLALLLERQRAFAAFTFLSLVPILASGTLMSAVRLLAVAFPAFAALARAGRSDIADRTIVIASAVFQALLFLAWSRFYWVA
ncbi:MAG TPA: mannosyltransferase family protein [Myxococcota bacterium]|nr:mannosyltransferase family protein [Myxococcota bacterium]